MSLRSSLIFGFMILLISCKDDKNNQYGYDAHLTELQIFKNDYVTPLHKWGVIDSTGKLIIPHEYDDIRDFTEHRASASKNGLWGYIDETNQIIVDFSLKKAGDFIDGTALVQYFDNTYAMVDRNGNQLQLFNDQKVIRGSDGVVKFVQGLHYKLNEADENLYEKIGLFKYDLAVAVKDGGIVVINKKGHTIFTAGAKAERLKICDDNLIGIVEDSEHAFYYNLITDEKSRVYTKLNAFQDGFSIVKQNDTYMIINRSYDVTYKTENKLRYLGSYRWGETKINDTYDIIDKTGDKINNMRIDGLYNYSDGIIAFKQYDLWGYLDLDCNVIIDPILSIIWDSKEDKIRAISENGFCFIDKKMELQFYRYFREARDFKNGYARVQK